MSRALSTTEGDYLHSPVDDLESFLWVAIWSIFFNRDHKESRSAKERKIADYLSENEKEKAIDSYSRLVCDATTSDIARRFQPVLTDWWKKVRDRSEMWSRRVLRGAPNNAGGEYYLPHFHSFALEGAVDVLQVLADHWNGDISWESWTRPAP